MAGPGEVLFCTARHGRHGKAGLGAAWPGLVWQGEAGVARRALVGLGVV